MAIDPFNWKCPYCGHAQVVDDHRYHHSKPSIYNDDSVFGKTAASIVTVVCANSDCMKMTLEFSIRERIDKQTSTLLGEKIYSWKLLPESIAKPQPDYIPQALRDDYSEACRIRDLSPKASATLSRRCLQGIIRDFWGVTNKPNLHQEIEAIEDQVEPEVWEAIFAVKSVGNIGAHMEKDVNIIVEVDTDEAELLIGLIETLFDECYVTRYNRQQKMLRLKNLGETKKQQREDAKNAASGEGQEPEEATPSEEGSS